MRAPVAAFLLFVLSVLVIETCALPTPAPMAQTRSKRPAPATSSESEESTEPSQSTPSKSKRPKLERSRPTTGGSKEQNVVLLNGFAYPDGKGGYNGALEFFTYARPKNPENVVQKMVANLRQGLKDGLRQVPVLRDVVNRMDRLKLFVVKPTGGSVSASVGSHRVDLKGEGQGITMETVKLDQTAASGDVQLVAQGGHAVATLYSSQDSGFGVVSDIDDTVKISNVLSPLKVAKATLIDSPKAVKGMPELYASLAKSLHSPLFVYISGSPFQLYPFIRDFVHNKLSASRGPIVLQKLPPGDMSWLGADATAIQAYKVKTFDEVVKMYPNKKFVLIGDSGQKDPEAYGQMYNKHSASVACIWIRHIDHPKANNKKSRFEGAFKGVPKKKYRVFTEKDLPDMQKLDVPNGHC